MGIPDPRKRSAACCLLVMLLTGCAATSFEPPHLSMVSVKMQSADLFSQKLLVRMRVTNPNARELPVKGISYRIEVGESELANGAGKWTEIENAGRSRGRPALDVEPGRLAARATTAGVPRGHAEPEERQRRWFRHGHFLTGRSANHEEP